LSQIFNPNNRGHLGVPSKLFLGEELGVIDTVNIQYPKLEELYLTQDSQKWNEFEVDLTQDRQDMLHVPDHTRDLMIKSLMWQTATDSVASRSITETIGRFCTSSELSNVISIWSYFETIHERTYTHIIKQCFTDPNEMLKGLYEEAQVLKRASTLINVFEEIATVPADTNPEELKKLIIKTLVAIVAMETVAFMASFAVTFGIAETGVYSGIGQNVRLICRDELLHGRMGMTVLRYLKQDPEWTDAFYAINTDCITLLDSIVERENEWADYLFSEGRQVVGLNAELLKEYTKHRAVPLYDFLGFPLPDECRVNPLPYMDNWTDGSNVQAAAQEIQLTNYKLNAVEDDTEGLEL
jgi:ribonucleoside-diphosphate reductase beta chain